MVDVFIPWSDISAEPFLHGGCVHPMFICWCWVCLFDMVYVFIPWSDVSVGQAFMTGLDISVEEDEDLHGG